MRVARWRWALVLMVVVVAGCLPRPTTEVPASFLERVQSTGSSFAAAAPPSGAMTMDEAIEIARGRGDALAPMTPVQAIYGTVTCPDPRTCAGAFDAHGGVLAFPAWIVWSQATAGPDVGVWVGVNADMGNAPFSGPLRTSP